MPLTVPHDPARSLILDEIFDLALYRSASGLSRE